NVTGSNFTSVTIAPDTATIVKPVVLTSMCPANITKNTDANVCTAMTTFTPPTADGCPAPTVTCVPASGFAFPKGTTTVTCTATNGSTSAMCSFTVTVNDNQAPVLSGCTNQTINTAAGVCTATATYTPTATDNCDGSRPVMCIPASGSTFNKGVTTVSCSASDLSSNTGMCSFTITVNDNQPPVVTCPASGGAFAASDCLPSQRSA